MDNIELSLYEELSQLHSTLDELRLEYTELEESTTKAETEMEFVMDLMSNYLR